MTHIHSKKPHLFESSKKLKVFNIIYIFYTNYIIISPELAASLDFSKCSRVAGPHPPGNIYVEPHDK